MSGNLNLTLTGPFSVQAVNTFTGATTITSTGALFLGNEALTGSVPGPITDDGNLTVDEPGAFLLDNAVSGSGSVYFESGTISVDHANTYSGGTRIDRGTVALGNPFGLGTSTIALNNAALLGTKTESLSNVLQFGFLTPIFAAAHGKTLTLASTNWSLTVQANSSSNIGFGDGTNDGTVVWTTPGLHSVAIGSGGSYTVEVLSGTLKDGDGSLSDLLSPAQKLMVDAGAVFDGGGHAETMNGLYGAGTIKKAVSIDVKATGNFAGKIAGGTHLIVDAPLLLTGGDTYKGGTIVNNVLALGDGGTTGSIKGNVTDNGSLIVDRSDQVNLTSKISGPGELDIAGTGVVAIHHANTYSGGTTINAGTLDIDRGSALGTGPVTVAGGTLRASANATLAGALHASGDAAFLAADGVKLTLNKTAGYTISGGAGTTLNFGSATDGGTVVWDTAAGSGVSGGGFGAIAVHGGVLQGGSGLFSFLFENTLDVAINSGASIDLHGDDVSMLNLHGKGSVIDSGAAAELDLTNSDFAGAIDGPVSVGRRGPWCCRAAGRSPMPLCSRTRPCISKARPARM